jgi:hypothetical protein
VTNGFSDIFNEQGAVLAALGAMGGVVRALTLKTTWREGLRVIVVGTIMAFGVGMLGPFLLRPWIGELPDGLTSAFGIVAASAFIIGLMGITIIENWLVRSQPQKPEGDGTDGE